MQSVWWKCHCGHRWKVRICDRAIDGEDGTVCEGQFRRVLPKLLVTLYAKQKGLEVLIDSDKAMGLPLDAYAPELCLAIDFSDQSGKEKKKVAAIKEYICAGKDIMLISVPFLKTMDDKEHAIGIRKAFWQVHVHFASDVAEDTRRLREQLMYLEYEYSKVIFHQLNIQ